MPRVAAAKMSGRGVGRRGRAASEVRGMSGDPSRTTRDLTPTSARVRLTITVVPPAAPAAGARLVAAYGRMAAVNPADFGRVASRFASGIVVVSTSLNGVGHAMTVTAFTSVSLEPQLVLFCAEKVARFHDAVLATGTWAVSVLNEDGEKTARWLATRGRPLAGQLDAFRHHPGR